MEHARLPHQLKLATRTLVLLSGAAASTLGQWWELRSQAGETVSKQTGNRLQFRFESRLCYEDRTGQLVGASTDLFTGLVRHRRGLRYHPLNCLKVSAMVQDAPARWYGPNASREHAGFG